MNTTHQILFWVATAGVVYIFAGYPVLITVLAKLFPRSPQVEGEVLPFSILITACNEEATLKNKLDNIFASKMSEKIVEVLVASDGSTDRTCEIVRLYNDSRVQLHHFNERRGKPAMLNDVVPQCQSEIVVLMDVRQMLSHDALVNLVQNFNDETIGVVSGELVFREDEGKTTASQGVGFYWKYEKFIRKNESLFASVPGATGAFYGIRKNLFQPIPEQTLLDDVQIPMQAVVQKKRCIFEPRAVIYDTPSQSTQQESIRKRRTIAGAAQLILMNPSWLLLWKNPIWMQYLSHKVARIFSPLLLIIVAVTNLLLWQSQFYRTLLILQILFYFAAILGWVFQKMGKRSRLLGPFLMFLSLNITTLFALWDAARGKFRVTWQRSSTSK